MQRIGSKRSWMVPLLGMMILLFVLKLVGGVGKYGRLLGWLYIGDADSSLNEQMIDEGYAWPYDGGTKQKNFEDLREIRRAHGTLV